MPAADRRYFLGCSGYFYRDWRGKFYPPELKPSRWLRYYAEFFDTVELNSTFYSFPKVQNLKRFYRETPEGFVFSVKMNRTVTHLRRMRGTEELVRDFYRTVREGLGEKLRCVLFQMPPSYRYSPENLQRILDQLQPEFVNVVEFRHRSWWCPEVTSALRDAGVVFCSVSSPELPEELVETASVAYVRFHGRESWYRYRYSDEELAEWARRIKSAQAREFYLYFNNDYNANAVENCRKLRELLRAG